MFRKCAVILLAIVFAIPALAPSTDDAGGFVVDHFKDGTKERTITFTGQGNNKDISVELDNNATITDATMYVTGLPDGSGRYPSNVTINFGDNSNMEWKFQGAGYGRLGQQYMFNDSKISQGVEIPSSGMGTKGAIRLPAGATVTSATMNVKGVQAIGDDFEAGIGKWTATGLWHLTSYRYQSTGNSAAYNQESGHTFDTGVTNSGTLELKDGVDLSAATSPHLKFYSWQETENGAGTGQTYDQRYVQVSTDGGSNWASLTWSPAISSCYQTWYQYDFDLAAYSSATNFLIRFYFNTVDSIMNNYEGWYVDDVELTGFAAPTDPSLDVGADGGTSDWSFSGEFASEAMVPNFASSLTAYLATATPTLTDDYGNRMVDVPMGWTAPGGGNIAMSQLQITYTWMAAVTKNPGKNKNLASELNQIIFGAQSNVTIPIAVHSDTAGKVKLSDVAIEYNDRPRFKGIPNQMIDEDTAAEHFLNLADYWTDDYEWPENLTYSVSNDKKDYVAVEVVDGHYLSVDATLEKNWNSDVVNGGLVEVVVKAKDSGNRTTVAEPFNIYVAPVNDEPRASLPLPHIIMEEGETDTTIHLKSQDYYSDAEYDALNYDAIVDPQNAREGENLTVKINPLNFALEITAVGDYFTPDGEPVPVWVFCDDDTQVNTIADGPREDGKNNWTYQQINVTVINVNDAPVWGDVPNLVLDEDETLMDAIYLPDHITDIDTDLDDMEYSIAQNSNKRIKVTVDDDGYVSVEPAENAFGTASVEVEADDGGDESGTTFKVTVNPVNDLPLADITSHLTGAEVQGTVAIYGSSSDIEGEPQYVEVMIGASGTLPLDMGVPGGTRAGPPASPVWVRAGGTKTWTYQWSTLDGWKNGDYDVRVRAFDGEAYSANFTITLKLVNPINEPPSILVTSPADNTEVEKEIEIKGTALDDDAVQLVQMSIGNNYTWQSVVTTPGQMGWSTTINVSGKEPGNLTIYFKAFDGEKYSHEDSVTLVVVAPEEDTGPTDLGSTTEDEDGSWLWLLLIIIIVVVVVLIVAMVAWRSKKQREKELEEERERQRKEEAEAARMKAEALDRQLRLATPAMPAPGGFAPGALPPGAVLPPAAPPPGAPPGAYGAPPPPPVLAGPGGPGGILALPPATPGAPPGAPPAAPPSGSPMPGALPVTPGAPPPPPPPVGAPPAAGGPLMAGEVPADGVAGLGTLPPPPSAPGAPPAPPPPPPPGAPGAEPVTTNCYNCGTPITFTPTGGVQTIVCPSCGTTGEIGV